MACSEQDIRRAWKALRAARRKLGTGIKGNEQAWTGYAPALAREQLLAAGSEPRVLEEQLHLAILRRFPAFADSWDNYVDQSGWLLDLLEQPLEERQRSAARWRIGGLLDSAVELKRDPAAAVSQLPRLGGLMRDSAALQGRREKGEHPAGELMVARYGMHPELAKAVLLHGRLEPWWAHLAIAAAWLVCGALFLLALTDPQNPAFVNDSVGGVGPLHYIALPLFALLFFAAQAWLIYSRPARQRAWRAQLERYRQSVFSGVNDSGVTAGSALREEITKPSE